MKKLPDAHQVLRYMPLVRFLSLIELKAMWFSRLGALQDKYEGTNPKGPRAFLMQVAKESPDFVRAKTPWGGSYDELLAVTDNGRSGDTGRKMLLINCWFIGDTETQKMWRGTRRQGKGRRNPVNDKTALNFFPDHRPNYAHWESELRGF